METGDIIIVLDEKDHERFGRKGSDLILKMVCCVIYFLLFSYYMYLKLYISVW